MIAILSDIHGNLPALQAVMHDALAQGCQRFISLGDVVSYYAEPGECIDLLRKHRALNIMGNHDRYLVSGSNCPRSRAVSRMLAYQQTLVSAEQLAWLAQSPASYREGEYYFVHGGPEDPQDQYLYQVSEETIPADARILFSGHTHVQVLAEFATKIYCNPGSVGQPRDGDSRAAYAILAEGKIILQRVNYDIGKTVEKMKQAGFEPFFYTNLYLGAQIGGRIDKIDVIK